MMLMTIAMSLPRVYTNQRCVRASRLVTLTSGVVSVAFGLFLVYQIGIVNGLFSARASLDPELSLSCMTGPPVDLSRDQKYSSVLDRFLDPALIFWGGRESNGRGKTRRRRWSQSRVEIGCFPRGDGSTIAHGWNNGNPRLFESPAGVTSSWERSHFKAILSLGSLRLLR